MTINRFITIDPGASGGIALYRCHSEPNASAFKMPKTVELFSAWLQDQKEIVSKKQGEMIIMIEHQQSFGESDMKDGKHFGIQKLIASYNQLVGAIKTNEVKFFPIMPRYWQADLKLSKLKDEESKDRKNRYKVQAAKYFPYVKGNLNTTDALCMLHFLKLKLQFDRMWIENKFK